MIVSTQDQTTDHESAGHEPAERKRGRGYFGFRRADVVYFAGQPLHQHLERFDHVFVDIARRVPRARFGFIQHSSPQISRSFIDRINGAFARGGLSADVSCRFLPLLSPGDFLALQDESDVVLDSIGWSSASAATDALSKQTPMVCLWGQRQHERHAAVILRCVGLGSLVAADEASYVERAVELALDPGWYEQVVRALSERCEQLYANVEVAQPQMLLHDAIRSSDPSNDRREAPQRAHG